MLGYTFAVVIGVILIALAFAAFGGSKTPSASAPNEDDHDENKKPVQMDSPSADEPTPDRSATAQPQEVAEAKKRTPPA
jgi:hypothetical protein